MRRTEEGTWAASDESEELHCQTPLCYVMRIPLSRFTFEAAAVEEESANGAILAAMNT